MPIATVTFVLLSRSPKSHGVMSRSWCDLEMTFSDFVEIEASRPRYGGLLICRLQMVQFIFYQGHPKSRCDLEMTFNYFMEIEPYQLGYGGLLISRSQCCCLFFYLGHSKVTV